MAAIAASNGQAPSTRSGAAAGLRSSWPVLASVALHGGLAVLLFAGPKPAPETPPSPLLVVEVVVASDDASGVPGDKSFGGLPVSLAVTPGPPDAVSVPIPATAPSAPPERAAAVVVEREGTEPPPTSARAVAAARPPPPLPMLRPRPARSATGEQENGTEDRDPALPARTAAARPLAPRGTDTGGLGVSARRAAPGSVGVSQPGFALGAAGNPKPPYPNRARERGWQGRVLLRVSVDVRGRVLSIELAQSSGFGILDRAARDAVGRWRFTPATRSGRPVPGVALVPVVFALR